MTDSRLGRDARKRGGIVVTLALVTTLIYQCHQVYEPVYVRAAAKRALLHDAIVAQQLPAGYQTWDELGANGAQVRRIAVESAELLRTTTGLSLKWSHFLQDTLFMFLGLLLLYVYMRHYVSPPYAFIALLYIGLMGPLLARYGFFHPWDRMVQVAWVLGLIAMARRNHIGVLLASLVGVAITDTTILMPGLYLAHVLFDEASHRDKAREYGVALLVCALAFGERAWIRSVFASGNLAFSEVLEKAIEVNLADIKRSFVIAWEPVLFYALPLTLSVAGLRTLPRRLIAQVVWVLACIGIAMTPHGGLKETRNQLPFLFALLPPAMLVLQRVLDENDAAQTATQRENAALIGRAP